MMPWWAVLVLFCTASTAVVSAAVTIHVARVVVRITRVMQGPTTAVTYEDYRLGRGRVVEPPATAASGRELGEGDFLSY